MASPAHRPKLVFFRWTRPGLPHFIEQHLREQLRCLEHHFEVVLVSEDCDYAQVCETHRPDLTLFESGVYAGPRSITNTSAFPDIPKVGFCNADAYCATRSVFLSDMERWGVETFFTLSVAMGEYTPDIADRLFVWPNFIDPDVHRDYGQPKNIPVLFTGSQAAHYPWRSRVHSIVTQRYPSLTTPHGGWFDAKAAARMVHGDGYARLLNAALVAPACGGIAREVARKLFEIPAARTCLVTERTAAVEAAGFVDMQNAVFADPDDVMDKLDHLFSNPAELERITDAGFDLAHSRHSMARRDQLLQWFHLHRDARPGQRIVQDGPFEPLRLTESSAAGNSHPVGGGLQQSLLRRGQQQLERGRLQSATELLLRCLNYHFMPEPILSLTRRHLYGGAPDAAIGWVRQTIERSLGEHCAQDPDPVEWAFFVRALLCKGEVDEAARRAAQFGNMTHLELERVRRVVAGLSGHPGLEPPAGRRHRHSVHVLPERDLSAWVEDLCKMLEACGQDALAKSVRTGGAQASGPHRTAPGAPEGRTVLPLVSESPLARLKVRTRQRLREHWRGRTANAPHASVRQLMQKEDLGDALLIGASATARSTRAVLAGLRANVNAPGVYWLREATPGWLPGRARRPGRRAPDTTALADLRREEGGNGFDVVVVGSPPERDESQIVDAARLLVLTGINHAGVQPLHARLIEDRTYALVTHHATHDGGYSVFRKIA